MTKKEKKIFFKCHLKHGREEQKRFLLLLLLLLFFRATPAAYVGSQATGQIGAIASGLHYSHSNAGSELCLRPTPQFIAMPDS